MKRTLAVVLTLLASALLAACGDRADALPLPQPAPENIIKLDEVQPAEVVVLSLAKLGFPAGADKVTSSGAVSDAILQDGTLRFSTPGDTGADQEASFEIQGGSTKTKFRVLIRSRRPTLVLEHRESETLEDGTPIPPAPPLIITGLGPNNAITGAPLTFKLQGIAGLDLKDDSNVLVIGNNNVAISLKKFWVFNPADSSFSISGTAMQQLLAALPAGSLDMTPNFVSKDGTFAVSYDVLATGPGAKLSGKLQSPQGNPITSLAGRKVLLKGFNSEMRSVALVDSNGAFSFEGVIPDTYQLTLNDLQNPNVVSASTEIFVSTTQANVTLVVPSAIGISTSAKLAAVQGGAETSSYVASTVTQNGKGPARRSARSARAMLARPTATLAADGASATFSATAAGQGQTITTAINFTVPAGTKNVGVKITVFTEEYPEYTTKQSEFNDAWAYSVVGLPATVLSASGSVNQSHYTQGTTTRTECVDVTEQAKNGALTVSGIVSATNIGDSILPTTTTVELTLACKGLKVSSASFSSPNGDGHPIFDSIKKANLAGPYLSIQRSGSDATHTIPLEINYTPAEAKITEVNIGVSSDGTNPTFTTDNLLGQTHADSPGTIKFSRLSLPAFAGGMADGKLVVTVRIKGTIEDTDVTSDPAEGGQVSFNGKTAFTPLYLAGNVANLSGRRYGSRDAGGDSWSTKQIIDWLSGKPYRFDDISAMHVTQTSSGGSILGHKGHSDGQQIDMRYADGQGGFSDGLGGQSDGAQIAKLINDAAAEVANKVAQKPKLTALQAWIGANRALLDLEAASASTRAIFIGPSFIKLALVDAKFPAASPAALVAIPGVTAWVQPERVTTDPAHMNHWHLSMTAHP